MPAQTTTTRNKDCPPTRLPRDAWTVDPEAAEVPVEITPGKVVKARLPKRPPRFVIFGLTNDDATGEYKVAPALWNQLLPMSAVLPELLGIPVHANSFYRLCYGGFFHGYKVTPQNMLIDAASILAHLRRTRIVPGQPSYWTKERRALYAETQEGPAAMTEGSL